MLTSIFAGLAWVASNLWVLFIALVPAIASFLAPVLSAVTEGIKGFVGAIWSGAKQMNFYTWLLTFTLMAAAAAVGYHYGWLACIDWVHTHFKLLAKTAPSKWWKLW